MPDLSDRSITSSEGPGELELAIQDLQAYRQRLVLDVMTMGHKLKLPQARVERDLLDHPEIKEVDQLLSQLGQQRAGNA